MLHGVRWVMKAAEIATLAPAVSPRALYEYFRPSLPAEPAALAENAIVGVIRFSVLSTSYNPFKVSRNLPVEAYFEHVLAPKRLQQRLAFLANICLPSLDAQTDKGFKILLAAPRLLPAGMKRALHRLTEDRPYLHVVFVDETGFRMSSLTPLILSELVRTEGAFATFRLDDDDAVAADFIAMLRRYTQPIFDDCCVSLCRGVLLDMSRPAEGFGLKEVQAPNASAGLAYISTKTAPKTIFDVSDRHIHMHKRRPVVQDGRELAFVQTTHTGNDTGLRRALGGKTMSPRRSAKRLARAGVHVRLCRLAKTLAKIESAHPELTETPAQTGDAPPPPPPSASA